MSNITNNNEGYFKELIEKIESRKADFFEEWKPIYKKGNHTEKIGLGNNIYLNFVINRGKKNANYGIDAGIVVVLLIESGKSASSYFNQLKSYQKDIEEKLGIQDMQWREAEDKEKRHFIYVIKKADESKWIDYIDWHIDTMEKFMEIFKSYVKVLKKDNGNTKQTIPTAQVYPDEISEHMYEGAQKNVIVNAYERNPKARKVCLEKHGYNCSVCSLNLQDKYGDIGKNFIHVHHLIPISEIKEKYIIRPMEDLIPVCPNCHAMLHKKNPPYSVEELKEIILELKDK